jgi:ankyrin repeat protein
MYDRNIDRILEQESTDRECGMLTLSFLRDACRPVLKTEVEHMLRVNLRAPKTSLLRPKPTWRDIERCCKGLIQLQGNELDDRRATFIHPSFGNHYLRSKAGSEKIPKQHKELAKRCTAYLSMGFCETGVSRDEAAFRKRLEDWPFFEYSARHWSHHLRKSLEGYRKDEVTSLDSILLRTVMTFLRKNAHVEAATQITLFDDLLLRSLLQRWSVNNNVAREKGGLVCEAGTSLDTILFEPNLTIGLHLACQYGFKPLVEGLIGPGFVVETLNNLDHYGWGPLHYAALEGHTHIVSLLLQRGADPCQKVGILRNGKSSSEEATKECHYGGNALTVASFYDRSHAVVQHLLGLEEIQSTLCHATDVSGNNALHRAAMGWHGVDNLKMLMGAFVLNDIDLNIRNRRGMTPLALAVETDNESQVEALLSVESVDVNVADHEGRTPLHHAVRLRNEDSIRLLLGRDGIQLNMQDKGGLTPLALAVASPGYRLFDMLWRFKGVDITVRDKRGWTILQIAEDSKAHQSVLECLRRVCRELY